MADLRGIALAPATLVERALPGEVVAHFLRRRGSRRPFVRDIEFVVGRDDVLDLRACLGFQQGNRVDEDGGVGDRPCGLIETGQRCARLHCVLQHRPSLESLRIRRDRQRVVREIPTPARAHGVPPEGPRVATALSAGAANLNAQPGTLKNHYRQSF